VWVTGSKGYVDHGVERETQFTGRARGRLPGLPRKNGSYSFLYSQEGPVQSSPVGVRKIHPGKARVYRRRVRGRESQSSARELCPMGGARPRFIGAHIESKRERERESENGVCCACVRGKNVYQGMSVREGRRRKIGRCFSPEGINS
jgi:hypothetical protein